MFQNYFLFLQRNNNWNALCVRLILSLTISLLLKQKMP